MKKVLSFVLVIALVLSLVIAVPSFADAVEFINVDWIESTDGSGTRINLLTGAFGGAPNGAGTKGAMFGDLTDDVEAGAQYIHFIGWYMPLAALADVGVSIDGGSPVYGGYMTEEQGLYTALAAYDNVVYVRRINFYYPIEDGSHTLELVAKFTDDSTKVIFNGYYTNGGNVALGKPVYSTISGTGAFNSNNVYWNINYINDGSAKLFDGKTNEPLGWYAASAVPDVESTVTIDLQGQYAISRIVLQAMGFNNTGFPNTYRVLVSADGINWKDVGGEAGVVANFYDKLSTYQPDVTARYVRIYSTVFNLAGDGSYYGGLGEVEVFGTLVSEDDSRVPFAPASNHNVRTAQTADAGGLSAWTGYSTGDLDYSFTFRTDVSFWGIGFPCFWSAPATPLTFSFYSGENKVYSFDYTTAGDGAIALPLGTTLPAGEYTCVMTINDDSINGETGYYTKYVVLGYASEGKLLDTEYCDFERGNVAFDLYTTATAGEGFIKLDYTPVGRDFSKAEGDNLSYDTIFVNGTNQADGNDAVIALKKLVDGSDGSITSVGLRGWYGNKNYAIESFGYTVDGGEPVYGDFKEATEDAVLSDGNGGPFASRYLITVDVTGLAKGKDYTIRAVAKLSNGDVVVLNRVDNPGTDKEKDRDVYLIYRAETKEGFALDAVSVYGTYAAASGANFNNADTITITEGDRLYILGWAYKTYTGLSKVVYRIDDGDAVEGSGSFRARDDVANVSSISNTYTTNSGIGLDNAMYEFTGIKNLSAGTYRLRFAAVFEDGTSLEMRDVTLVVEEGPGLNYVKTNYTLQCDEFGYYGTSGLIQSGKNEAELGQIKPIVEGGATSIKMYGWLYPEKEISDIGFSVDRGEITWGCAYYDQAIIDVFNKNALPYAAFARRYDTSKAGNFTILEGHHTIQLIAYYADETYEILYEGDYYNDDTVLPKWFPVKEDSTNAIGLWLNQADSYAAAIFSSDAPFDAIKIPAQWSSRPDGGKPATFEVALYKFVYNFEESIKLTPIASVVRTPAGDEGAGFILDGFEAEAGEYVFMVKIVELAPEAYTVLPVVGDANVVGYVLNNAANADSFNFLLHAVAEESVFGAIPVATEVPGGATVVDPATIETVDGEGFSISVPEAQEGEEPVQKIVVDSNTISALYNANEEASVEIKFESTAITLDKSAFGAIADSDEDLVIDVKVADATALNDAQKEVVENVALVISVDAFLGDNALHELGGNATFAVPYELPEGVDPANVKVAYVTDDGQVEELEAKYVDGKIEFSVSHFSVFVVSVATPAPAATGNGSVFAAVVVVLMAGALVALIAKKRRNEI